MWFEVFSSGEHISMNGSKQFYSLEDLDNIVLNYKKRSENELAPAVIGHPKDNEPAVGKVVNLARRQNKLVADIKFIDDDFIDALENGKYNNLSISLSDKYNVNHIGFLGAVAPAVKGLRKIDFSQNNDNDLIVNLIEENINLKAKAEQEQKEHRLADFRNYIEQLNKEKNILLSPIATADAIDLMELAHEKDEEIAYFSKSPQNDSYLNKIKNLLEAKDVSNLTKENFNNSIFDFSNFNHNNQKYNLNEHSNLNEERLLLHNQAISLIKNDPMLSYEEALSKALTFYHHFNKY